ncbi:hypothetical protein PPO43_00750 [Saprospira sp. CCB-QB6]|uniref:hypothetical protein n=1 Tax=Saprospira sp. CCB-QB6 TaxID=3023936 RepID=UPI00234B8359|nr:hypothetical protein [Saprospira sp. CCB-QB6]WCL81624.1 hypothetical protein PPO43_00750 [Saprospira sp. CCB-QB6]
MLVASHNILLDEEGPLNETSCFILNAGPTTYGFRLNTSRLYFKEEEHSIYLARTESYVIAIGQKLFAFSMLSGKKILFSYLADDISAILYTQLGPVLITDTTVLRLDDFANCTIAEVYMFGEYIIDYHLKESEIDLYFSDEHFPSKIVFASSLI